LGRLTPKYSILSIQTLIESVDFNKFTLKWMTQRV
jgi:hypothetical protein